MLKNCNPVNLQNRLKIYYLIFNVIKNSIIYTIMLYIYYIAKDCSK